MATNPRRMMMYCKQTCFDPRDPDYDGPEDDELDDDEPDYEISWDNYDNPADDYIMTDAENRGLL
jgi:hypothetical protein